VGEDLVAHLGLVLMGRRGRWKARRGSSAALGAGSRGGWEIPVRGAKSGNARQGRLPRGP
jgi:hypothetical protein